MALSTDTGKTGDDLDASLRPATPFSQFRERFLDWAHRVKLERKLAVALLVAAVTSGTLTFAAMSDSVPRTIFWSGQVAR